MMGFPNSKLKTKNSKLCFAAVLFLLATGCAGTPTALVPVATPCPQPPPLVRPHLAIQDIKPVAAPAEVLRAYVVTVEQLRGYAEELEIIINGYRK